MESDLLRVFAALETASVKYLVVGGVAVVLHGHLRVTADVDLVVKLEVANARAAMQALAGLGFRPRAPVPIEHFADAAIRKSWIEEKGLTVFSLWNAAMRGTEVDVFVAEPFDFDATYARAIRATIDGVVVSVVALDDLIALKQTTDDWEEHKRQQLRSHLALSHAERLRWLEQVKGFAAAALGAAKPSIVRVGQCVRTRFPGARIDTQRYVNGWWMDIVCDDYVVIEFRAGIGFGLSVLTGSAMDHFAGHDHTFATVDALEAHIRSQHV